MLTVVSTDNTDLAQSGREESCKWTGHNELIRTFRKKLSSAPWICITSDPCIARLCLLQFGDLKLISAQLSNWDIESRSWFSKLVQGCKISSWFINIHLAILYYIFREFLENYSLRIMKWTGKEEKRYNVIFYHCFSLHLTIQDIQAKADVHIHSPF